MRIGFFADMYLPHISGVTHHMRLYKRYFEACGHEVFLFTFGGTGMVGTGGINAYPDDEPNVIRTPAFAWGNTGWNLGIGFNRRTRELIPTLDIAHIHHPFQSGRLAVSRLKRHNIPIVFTNHSRYDLSAGLYARAVPEAFRRYIVNTILQRFLDDCALIIAPSDYAASWLHTQKPNLPIRVLANGIEVGESSAKTPVDFFGDDATKAGEYIQGTPTPTRASFGFSTDDFILCSVGRIAPEKNFHYLLEEFLIAADRNPHLRLIVIGDGPDFNQARATAAASTHTSSIVFTGLISQTELTQIAALSDAFVTASVIESFGIAVVEALAVGLPVVAIKAAGIAENVTHGKSGLLASAAKPNVLAREILTIADNPKLCAALSANAREEARRFSLKNTAGVLLDYYEELLV